MADAKIVVEIDGMRAATALHDVDMNVSRNTLGLQIGLAIVDAIWAAKETGK